MTIEMFKKLYHLKKHYKDILRLDNEFVTFIKPSRCIFNIVKFKTINKAMHMYTVNNGYTRLLSLDLLYFILQAINFAKFSQ